MAFMARASSQQLRLAPLFSADVFRSAGVNSGTRASTSSVRASGLRFSATDLSRDRKVLSFRRSRTDDCLERRREGPSGARSRHVAASSSAQSSETLEDVIAEEKPTLFPADDETSSAESDDEEKSAEYSATMQAAMGNAALVYQHELGMNYARVLPDLIVGSCLQSVEDVDTLRDNEGVGTVLCLQQDSDMAWFNLDINPIIERTKERGDIAHVRSEIRDFDPFSLRLELPLAVAKLHKGVLERGTAYVHCTAGLGRAPAVALAYMWWMRDFARLEDANEVLQAVRRCGPKLFAIRDALCDVLTGNPMEPATVQWRVRGTPPKTVEVAGLDVGWHNRLALEKVPGKQLWSVSRELPVGKYYYKFIIDGDKWSYNIDGPLTTPDRDNNVNNYIELPGSTLDASAIALRKRLAEEGVVLEEEERKLVMERISAIAATL